MFFPSGSLFTIEVLHMNPVRQLSAAIILVLTLFAGCTEDNSPDQKIISRINDYQLTQDEFQIQLARELELDEDFKLTAETRRQFLEELIRKELLIQEAKRRKLDQKKQFIQTIERYWESTLIRNLLDMKSREISSKVVVSEEEIAARFAQMKQKTPGLPPLEQVHKQIEMKIREEKKSALLKEWVSGLRDQADVRIDLSLLSP
jgi:hypothetical protein